MAGDCLEQGKGTGLSPCWRPQLLPRQGLTLQKLLMAPIASQVKGTPTLRSVRELLAWTWGGVISAEPDRCDPGKKKETGHIC